MKNKKTVITILSVIAALTILIVLLKFFQRKQAREILNKRVSALTKLDLQKAFALNRWETGDPKISDTSARAIATKINGSIGWFTEDEDAINKAFYGIKTYDDLSLIAYQYNKLYKKDLYTVIKAAYKNDNVKLARLRSIIALKVQMK